MVKRADWVTTKTSGGRGFVTRLAKDGSWADVRWYESERTRRELGLPAEWVKRMPTSSLTVLHTLPVEIGGQRWTVTDMTRLEELERESSSCAATATG